MGQEGTGSGTEHKSKEKVIQVIFGCGSIGSAIAKELEGRGLDIVIVDIDERKVELLKEEDLITFAGDIRDPDVIDVVKTEGNPEVVFILSSDGQANRKAVTNIKEALPDAQLAVRAIGPVDKEALKELDVDVILAIPDITARAAMDYLERMKFRRKAKGLTSMLEAIKVRGDGKGKLGIVIHDSPDPDAIASALALQHIARTVGVSADILYRGEIGHHENRAFVNILGIEMRRIEGEDAFKDYDKLALVDAAIPGANNPLPPGSKVNIIIDHHAVNNGKVDADFMDIRTDNGATSTIMMRYLQELDIPADKVLATALLHGIRTDTAGFRRETHTSDFSAAAFLHVTASKDLLDQIETPPMSTEMLNVIGGAIQHKKIKGSYLITNVGNVANRDAIPLAADYLLRLEGITTVVVIGLCEDKICISGRSKDIRVNIGDAFVRAFGSTGSAGGHATMAAAQLPLGVFSGVKDKDTVMQLAEDAVSRRFLSVMKEGESD